MLFLLMFSCSDNSENNSLFDVESVAIPQNCPGVEPDGMPIGSVDCQDGRCTIPQGAFWMGATRGEQNECPMREVQLSTYDIDETEVTISAWYDCVDDGNCEPIPEQCISVLNVQNVYSSDLPAICITWAQATSYCQWNGGRLPTEAEWEKAARGQNGSIWPWGNVAPTCDRANFRFASIYCNPNVVDVRSYEEWRSPYGLWDTLGNVWEWVSDYYDASYYEYASSENPLGPTNDCRTTRESDPSDCVFRGLRGGAFNTTEDTTRGSSRSFASPDIIDVNIGLRCAYEHQE